MYTQMESHEDVMLVMTKIDSNVNVVFTLVTFFVKLQKTPQNPLIPGYNTFRLQCYLQETFRVIGWRHHFHSCINYPFFNLWFYGVVCFRSYQLNWIKLNDVIILCCYDLEQVIEKDNFKLKLWLCVKKIYLSIVSYLFIM